MVIVYFRKIIIKLLENLIMLEKKDRKIELLFVLVALIFLLTYYFYPKDDYVMEMVKPSRPTIEKVEEVKETIKKSPIILPKTNIEEKAKEEKQIIERGKVLFTETDTSGRYTIQLLNAIDINLNSKDNSRNITIFGQIEDNSIKTDFSLSIGEEYINYLSDLKIKIVDSANNERVIETASYFLGALDLNSSYKIKLNISGDTLDGEMISSDKLPEDILKEIENSEQKIVNKEEN